MLRTYTLFILLLSISCSSAKIINYPAHWWKKIPKTELKWWEISPHIATKNQEVILSKRNELGILSNFSHAPFAYRGVEYLNVEALWQSMKYPEGKSDLRYKLAKWPYTREEVSKMGGPDAKKAGSFASKIMKANNIDWVTFEGKRMLYRSKLKGDHYKIILAAMKAKLDQNKNVHDVLKSTGNLILKADHKVDKNDPPAWKYYKIWMDFREDL